MSDLASTRATEDEHFDVAFASRYYAPAASPWSAGARLTSNGDISCRIFDELQLFGQHKGMRNRGTAIKLYLLVSRTRSALLINLRDERIVCWTARTPSDSSFSRLVSGWQWPQPPGISEYFARHDRARRVKWVGWLVMDHQRGQCGHDASEIWRDCFSCASAELEVASFLNALPNVRRAAPVLPAVEQGGTRSQAHISYVVPSLKAAFHPSYSHFGSRLTSLCIANANTDVVSALLSHTPCLEHLVLRDFLPFGHPGPVIVLPLQELEVQLIERDTDIWLKEDRDEDIYEEAQDLMQTVMDSEDEAADAEGNWVEPDAEDIQRVEARLAASGHLSYEYELFWPWLMATCGPTLRKLSLDTAFSADTFDDACIAGNDINAVQLDELSIFLPSVGEGHLFDLVLTQWPACRSRLSLTKYLGRADSHEDTTFVGLPDYFSRCGCRQVNLTLVNIQSGYESLLLQQACRFFVQLQSFGFAVELTVKWRMHAGYPAVSFNDSAPMLAYALSRRWLASSDQAVCQHLAEARLSWLVGHVYRKDDEVDRQRAMKGLNHSIRVRDYETAVRMLGWPEWPRDEHGETIHTFEYPTLPICEETGNLLPPFGPPPDDLSEYYG